jgi:hypothetical protein
MKLKSAVTLKDCMVSYTQPVGNGLVAYGLGRSLLVLVGPRQLRMGGLLLDVVEHVLHILSVSPWRRSLPLKPP